MDIGAGNIVAWIASSTTSSLATYSPIFLLIGGLVLAFGVMYFVIGIVSPGGGGAPLDSMDLDDSIEI